MGEFAPSVLAGTIYNSAFHLVDVTIISDDKITGPPGIAVWSPRPYCRNIFISGAW